MVDVANTITINRRVGEVVAYVTDLSNEPAWHTNLLEARRTSEGPVGIGTRYPVRFKPFMGNSEGRPVPFGAEWRSDGARPLDLEVRVGLHTGEVEILGDDVAGVGVHIAARVVAGAHSGKVQPWHLYEVGG